MIVSHQTISYAVLLLLVAAATQQLSLAIAGIVYLVGVIAFSYTNVPSAYRDLFAVVAVVTIFALFHKPSEPEVKEDFEITKAACNVYYVPSEDVASCDAGYYDETLHVLVTRKEELQKKIAEFAYPSDAAKQRDKDDLQQLLKVLDQRAKRTEAGIVHCKLPFTRMKQRSSVEMDPKKIMADAATWRRNGTTSDGGLNKDSSNWAFCYQEARSPSGARQIAAGYNARQVFNATPLTESPFEDGKRYVRVGFKNLQFDDLRKTYCQMNTANPLPPTFPEMLIGLNIDADLRIQDIGVYLKETEYEIKRYIYAFDVYRHMVEMYYNTKDSAIYLRETPRAVIRIHPLRFDPCNRVVEIPSRTRTMSLNGGLFNIPEIKIMDIRDPSIFDKGTDIAALNAKLSNYQTAFGNKGTELTALETAQSQKAYYPGLKKSTWYIPTSKHNGVFSNLDPLKIINEDAMTNVFNESKLQRGGSTAVTRSISVSNTGYWTHEAIMFEGLIKVSKAGAMKAGQYIFYIKSKNPCDLKINGVRVLDGYNKSNGNNPITVDSTVIDLPYEQGKEEGYHRISLRTAQWHTPDSLDISYVYRPTPNDPWSNTQKLSDLSDVFFYDDTPNYASQIAALRIDRANLESKIAQLAQVIQVFENVDPRLIMQLLKQIIGKRITTMGYQTYDVSNDSKLYIDVKIPLASIPIPPYTERKRIYDGELAQDILGSRENVAERYFINPSLMVNYTGTVLYTWSSFLYVHKPAVTLRPIFFFGIDRNDSSPLVGVIPGSSASTYKLSIEHTTTDSGVVKFVSKEFEYKRTYFVGIAFKDTEIIVYRKAYEPDEATVEQLDRFSLSSGALDWDYKPDHLSGKQVYVGAMRNKDNSLVKAADTAESPIYMEQTQWINRALTKEELTGLAKEYTFGMTTEDVARVVKRNLSEVFLSVPDSGVYSILLNSAKMNAYMVYLSHKNKAMNVAYYMNRFNVELPLNERDLYAGFPMPADLSTGRYTIDTDLMGHMNAYVMNTIQGVRSIWIGINILGRVKTGGWSQGSPMFDKYRKDLKSLLRDMGVLNADGTKLIPYCYLTVWATDVQI